MLRKGSVSFVAAVALALAYAVAAGAALPAPALKVAVQSTPTHYSASDIAGKDVYYLEVTNVGNAPTDGSPIVISDTVPSGLTYDPSGGPGEAGVRVNDYINGWELGVELELLSCGEGPPVECTVKEALQPGRSLLMWVPVTVDPGAPGSVVNKVSVTGGGAPSASASETTTISSAPPGPGFQNFDGGFLGTDGAPVSQAGAHPYDARLEFNLNTLPYSRKNANLAPVGNPKQLTVNLPAGLVVNSNATATRCTEAQFESDINASESERTRGCPDSSAVGVILPRISIFNFPAPAPSPLYNMVPPPGAPAELGFDAVNLGIYIHLFGGVRTGGDYGLSATSNDTLKFAGFSGATVELWGDPSDPSHDEVRGHCVSVAFIINGGGPCPTPPVVTPFLTLPSACSGPLTSTVSTNSWQEPASFVQDSFATHDVNGGPVGVTGCGKLGFNPSLSVAPETQAAGSPTGLNVDLRLPQWESLEPESQELLAEANLKKAVVTLPAGVTVSPSVANGLGVCTPEEIGLSSKEKPSCPDSSKVGSAEVVTPLLGHPLAGSLYVAQQGNNPFGSLVAVYLVVEADGAIVKLPGEVSLDPVTGQIVTTFDKSPQLPFSELKLHIFGGPRAALVTPSACGSYTTTGRLTPYSSETPVESNSIFQVTGGCGPQGFAPSFTAGTSSNEAGGFSPFSVTFSRNDSEQELGGVSVTTPPGLSGIIKGVERCPEPQAAQGACGANSLIGHTTATAGVGPDPVSVSGQVFLTGGYKGAPFGLSIVVPAVAGPFNLGNVVVRAAVYIDSRTAQITVVGDPLPRILQGVPLDIRTVNVTVDRQGFAFNPTSCDPLSVAGVLTSAQGATAAVSSRFQAANCAALAFHPSFKVSTQAKTSKAGGASLDVKVASTAGQANIGKTVVTLPKQLPARLTTIQQACPEATFAQNPASCPAASAIGIGSASTPILANPVTGPAYLVSHGGAAFPDVIVILQGEGVTVDLVGGVNIKKGITTASFDQVPDVPISLFELKMAEGPHSGLTANLPAKARGSMCGQKLVMPTTITGQNGAQIKQSTKIAVVGCPKAKKVTKKKVRHKKAKGKKRG